MESRLVREGVDAEEARRLSARLFAKERAEHLRERAMDLLRQGVAAKEAEDQLVAEGFDLTEAASAVCAERHKVAQANDDADAEDWRWGLLTGGAVFAVGVLLAIGNNTGLFPTFSYAGTILMGLGSLMLVGARR
jgi:hypothetical protein